MILGKGKGLEFKKPTVLVPPASTVFVSEYLEKKKSDTDTGNLSFDRTVYSAMMIWSLPSCRRPLNGKWSWS